MKVDRFGIVSIGSGGLIIQNFLFDKSYDREIVTPRKVLLAIAEHIKQEAMKLPDEPIRDVLSGRVWGDDDPAS